MYKKNLLNSWKEEVKAIVVERSVKSSKKVSVRNEDVESKMARSSKKEATVFDMKKETFLRFCSFELLELTNPIIKPILNILLFRKGSIEQ